MEFIEGISVRIGPQPFTLYNTFERGGVIEVILEAAVNLKDIKKGVFLTSEVLKALETYSKLTTIMSCTISSC